MAKDLLEGKKYPTDLLIVMLWAIIAVIGALALPDGNIVRIILGIPLLLFIPGYCMVSALWPEAYKEVNNEKHAGVNFLERLALSFGLSLAIVSFVGLALNYTPTGITLGSALIGNIIVVMVSGFVAYYRRSKLQPDERFSINITITLPKVPADRTEKVFVCAIGVALVLSCFTLGYVLLTPSQGEKFTEFYILSVNDTAGNYPVNLTINENGTVILGIVCHEYKETNYMIVAGLENSNQLSYIHDWGQSFSLTNGLKIARNITLNNRGIFEEPFTFFGAVSGSYKIIWDLYIDNIVTGYRVQLFVNIKTA